jgi:hypothetical protein
MLFSIVLSPLVMQKEIVLKVLNEPKLFLNVNFFFLFFLFRHLLLAEEEAAPHLVLRYDPLIFSMLKRG